MGARAEDSVVIKNIYWMMAYAFRALSARDLERLKTEEFHHLHELLAAILAIGMGSQMKRGFERDYLGREEDIEGIRGRLDMRGTALLRMAQRQEARCEFDEFTEDTQKNRILKAAARRLASRREVSEARRRELKRCIMAMDGVEDVEPSRVDWSRLVYHRNNATYQILMNVCRMVLEHNIHTEEEGEAKLQGFVDEQELSALYERFILEYYRYHYRGVIKASAKAISNGIEQDAFFLPRLQSDITLERGERTLIIDAKCYGKILNLHYDREIMSPGNRNQILSYVMHEAYGRDAEVSGMLLYARTETDRELDGSWRELGHDFRLRTLDLGRDFAGIAAQLDGIAESLL